ncbi:MAG: transcriptional regulator [Cetobacterium sp.]
MAKLRTNRDPALADAIGALGLQGLADTLGITVQAVSQWTRVPIERCLDVERATGVSRYRLRPDIYGCEPQPKARPKRAAVAA